MLPTIQVGPFAIQTPGLILLISLWLGLAIAERFSLRFGVSPNAMYNLALSVLLGGLAGARLSYIIQYPNAFLDNLLSIFSLNPGLLDPWGGAGIGLITGLIYAQRAHLTLWPTLDNLTPALAVIAIGTALANFASGNAYGSMSSLPWSIELWGASRHPTQIYSALAALTALLLTWPGNVYKLYKIPGIRFLSFIALTAIFQIFIAAFRGDSSLIFGSFRSTQVTAWTILALALLGMNRLAILADRKTLTHDS